MTLKEIDFNLIKINFEFKNQIVIILIEPYKTFKEIKNIVLDKFIDIFGAIPKNLHFYYQGLDLENKEQEKIGDLFEHKEQITIQIRLPRLKLKLKHKISKSINTSIDNFPSLRKSLILNEKLSIPSNINNECNISSENIQYTRSKTNKSYFKLNPNKTISNGKLVQTGKIKTKLVKSNSSSIIPFLNSEKKKPFDFSSLIKKYNFHINFNDIGNFAFCDKHKYKVSEYCRTCRKFICQECRFEELHKEHLTIQLNLNNLEESIKLYITLLQTNEKKNVKNINDFLDEENNYLIDDDILKEKENDIMDKFDKIINYYNSFMRKIDKKIGNDKKKYRIMVINNFNDVASRISMQIDTILNKFEHEIKNKQKKNISFEELQFYLDEISKKEETLELIRERTIKYLLTFEINNKVESAFDQIESTLDMINDETNPFHLDSKYNKELSKLLNISNNKKNEIIIDNENNNDNNTNDDIIC